MDDSRIGTGFHGGALARARVDEFWPGGSTARSATRVPGTGHPRPSQLLGRLSYSKVDRPAPRCAVYRIVLGADLTAMLDRNAAILLDGRLRGVS